MSLLTFTKAKSIAKNIYFCDVEKIEGKNKYNMVFNYSKYVDENMDNHTLEDMTSSEVIEMIDHLEEQTKKEQEDWPFC